jgi:hypothetical protein
MHNLTFMPHTIVQISNKELLHTVAVNTQCNYVKMSTLPKIKSRIFDSQFIVWSNGGWSSYIEIDRTKGTHSYYYRDCK